LRYDRPADVEEIEIAVSVVIVNWNTGPYIARCLESIYRPELNATVETFVVDNASKDGSDKIVASDFPQVNLIQKDRNLGFAAAANEAIRVARGRYILLLNPDTRLDPGALDKLIEFADHHPDVGIVGPKVLNEDGSLQPSCRHFPTIATGMYRNTFLGRWFPQNKQTQEYLMTDFDHSNVREVDWVSGAALLIRREAISSEDPFGVESGSLTEIGLLDEIYFMYCEDIDWCYRAHRHGWKVYYFPQAVVTHRKGASSDRAQFRCIVRHHRSLYRYFKKYYTRRFFLVRWAIALMLAVRAVTIMLKIVGRTVLVRILPRR